MLSYAIRVIPAFLGDLMTNAPHFGNQRTVDFVLPLAIPPVADFRELSALRELVLIVIL